MTIIDYNDLLALHPLKQSQHHS